MSTAERPTDDGATIPTRQQILLLLRRHGRLSAPRLAALLQLTSVGVRRHLGLLERDGLVSATVEKPRRGRPTAVYRLTDAGLETFPRHYDELALQALAFLRDRDDAATLHQFLAWRNERLAASYADRVEGATLAERAAALAEVLSEQGYMAEVEQAPGGGLRLCQHNCTVEHLASELPDLCASEAELFERLLGTTVQRETTIAGGGVRCVARIDPGRGRRPAARATTSPTPTAARSRA
jgi:predicted ArsR family transcriptional regulator